jgi:hypothetical protein
MFYKVKQAAYLINTSDYHVEKLIKNGLLKEETGCEAVVETDST